MIRLSNQKAWPTFCTFKNPEKDFSVKAKKGKRNYNTQLSKAHKNQWQHLEAVFSSASSAA